MALIVPSDVVHRAPEAKIQPPILPSAPVERSRLLERLAAVPDDVPLVLITAPAGCGKTTLLSQWAAADRRRFGWVTLVNADSDPGRLAAHLALALDRMAALDRPRALDSGALRALAAGNASPRVLVLPRLLASLRRRSQPGVLVLDDVHELVNVEAMNFIEALAAGVPPGFHIAIGPRLGLIMARSRSECRCVELDPDDLTFTEDESCHVFAAAAVSCS